MTSQVVARAPVLKNLGHNPFEKVSSQSSHATKAVLARQGKGRVHTAAEASGRSKQERM